MSARAGIVVTGTEVLTRARQRPQRPVAGRSAARARRRPRVHGDRRRPPRGHGGGAALHGARRASTSCSRAAASGRPRTISRLRSSAAFQGREMVLDEALARAHRRDRRAAGQTLAEPRPRGDPRGTASRRRPARARRVLEPVGTAPGLVVPPGAASARAGRRSSCCPARRASCSRCGRRRCRAARCRRRSAGATSYRQRHAAPVRDPRVGDRRDAARGRARRRGARSAWRSRPASNAARSRSSRATSRRRGGLRGLRGARARPSRRDAVLRGRRTVDRARRRRCCARTARARRARSPRPSRAPAGCSRRA